MFTTIFLGIVFLLTFISFIEVKENWNKEPLTFKLEFQNLYLQRFCRISFLIVCPLAYLAVAIDYICHNDMIRDDYFALFILAIFLFAWYFVAKCLLVVTLWVCIGLKNKLLKIIDWVWSGKMKAWLWSPTFSKEDVKNRET